MPLNVSPVNPASKRQARDATRVHPESSPSVPPSSEGSASTSISQSSSVLNGSALGSVFSRLGVQRSDDEVSSSLYHYPKPRPKTSVQRPPEPSFAAEAQRCRGPPTAGGNGVVDESDSGDEDSESEAEDTSSGESSVEEAEVEDDADDSCFVEIVHGRDF